MKFNASACMVTQFSVSYFSEKRMQKNTYSRITICLSCIDQSIHDWFPFTVNIFRQWLIFETILYSIGLYFRRRLTNIEKWTVRQCRRLNEGIQCRCRNCFWVHCRCWNDLCVFLGSITFRFVRNNWWWLFYDWILMLRRQRTIIVCSNRRFIRIVSS